MLVSFPTIQKIANSPKPRIRISSKVKQGSMRDPHFIVTKSLISSSVIYSIVVEEVSQSGVDRTQRILEHLRMNSTFLDSKILRKFIAWSLECLQYLSMAQRQLESISSSRGSRSKILRCYLYLVTGLTKEKSSLPRMKAI